MQTIQIVLITIWAIVMVSTIVLEVITQELQVFWFSLGALAALVLAFMNVSWQPQLIVFAIISILGFILLLRFRDNETVIRNYKTNTDSLVGQIVKVNDDNTVTLNSVKWQIANIDTVKTSKVKIIAVVSTRVLVDSVQETNEEKTQ